MSSSLSEILIISIVFTIFWSFLDDYNEKSTQEQVINNITIIEKAKNSDDELIINQAAKAKQDLIKLEKQQIKEREQKISRQIKEEDKPSSYYQIFIILITSIISVYFLHRASSSITLSKM